jgi:WD40 repeat protein
MVAVDRSVNGALFNHDESRILTWSGDGTARLWDARTGQPLGPALQHKERVNGALFSHDESRILTWSGDGTARIWPINIDLDFPTDYLSLWLGAMTGNQFDLNTRKEEPLSPAVWREIRSQYEKVAATHAKECKYPEFNEWLRESH